MKPDPPKRTRWIRWVVSGLALIFLALYIVFPVGMGVVAVLPGRQAVGPPPAGFEAVTLQTGDGISLVGWYAPPGNGAAILLLHGAGASRAQLSGYAQMLVRNGYGVLALDLRGHGESGGATNRLGWQSTPDVDAAVAYLQARPEVARIGGLGLSMGGEVLLGAASQYPQIAAIAADGATRRSTTELLALPSERPLVRNFTARVFYTTVQLLSRQQPPSPLLDSMVAARSTQFFLIAAGANSLEVAFNELFAATLGERASLWVAPDAAHTGAFTRYPNEYEQRLVAFFDDALVGSRTGAPPAQEPAAAPEATATPAPTVTAIDPTATGTAAPTCFVTGFAPVAFMPDSQRILVRGEAGVHIFNLETLQEEAYLEAPQDLQSPAVALSPDGKTLAWALPDFTIQLVRVADGEILHTMTGHTDIVTKLRFSPAGDRLYSASHDTWIRIWNMDGEEVGAFQPTGADNFPNQVLGLGLSPDGALLASVPFDGPVKVWDTIGYSLVAEIGGTGGFDTSDVAFSADGQYIAADLATGFSLWRMSDRTLLLSAINSMAFAFSPDGRYLAYTDIGANNAVILSSPDGAQITQTLEGHASPVWEMFFSPDGTWLASADGIEIRIWQVETGRLTYVGKPSCP